MAAQDVNVWIPEEYSGVVISKIAALSAAESLARVEPMGSETKSVMRSAGLPFSGVVAKNTEYADAPSGADEIILKALKFGVIVPIADEDVKDLSTRVDVVSLKMQEWARGHAIGFDNACLGVSAAANEGTVPFTSLYRALTQSNSAVGYTGNANKVATAGALTYAHLSQVFEKVETSDFYDEGRMVVIAHPGFKARLREITGLTTNGIQDTDTDALMVSDGRPVFEEHSRLGQGAPDRLFGAPIRWTLGAKVHATATSTPTGNPLLFVGNADYLVKGDRSGPEYMLAGADSGPAFRSDQHLLKMRIRRAFAVANENAWAVVEKS